MTEKEIYAHDCQEDLKKLIRELAVIPAPSHHEEQRVAYLLPFLEKLGAKDVFVDAAQNVIWPIGVTDSNDLTVIMAHTDIVFDADVPLKITEKDNCYYCPGVGDDTARLAQLIYAANYFVSRGAKPKCGILVVANACEEGLGNLKGSRAIVDTYGDRIREFYTIDADLGGICNRGVGSHRYRVTVRTEGGHSYGNFGNRNAIACLSSMISTLYDVKVPAKEGTKTTYNVGVIEGGTSVNTICQEASMLYEYRSDDLECLGLMKNMFEKVVDAYNSMGIDVEVELLGERPCGQTFKEEEYEAFLAPVLSAANDVLGFEPRRDSGSTDANYPLYKGIPAVCIGGCYSRGAHTREEYVFTESLDTGLRYVLSILKAYFEN